MEIKELIGCKLISVRTTYRDGGEVLSMFFEKDEDNFRLSIEAERGSDLWSSVKKVSKKKTQ